MKKLGYLFLLGGVLSLLIVILAAKDWHTFITDAQQASHVEIKIDPGWFRINVLFKAATMSLPGKATCSIKI